MKETRELQVATDARDEARGALAATTRKLRERLTPRMIAADVAELLAARATRVFFKSGVTRRRRITAAVAGATAIASAIALRAAQKTAAKKKR